MRGGANRKTNICLIVSGYLCAVTSAWGATATFAPVGPTVVEAGTNVEFLVSVSVETLTEFNTADILIGSGAATDVAFA